MPMVKLLKAAEAAELRYRTGTGRDGIWTRRNQQHNTKTRAREMLDGVNVLKDLKAK